MVNTQRTGTPIEANGHRRREWDKTAGFTEGRVTYYNRPMLKKPTWKWPIPLYFYLGGVAGGAAVIGAAAEFLGGPKHRPTVRHARYLSTALTPVCAFLLIEDLRRPLRFHHMLRVFKGSSPLNVGTWILSSFGATGGMLTLRQAAEDNFIIRRNSTLGKAVRLVPSGPVAAAHGLLGLAMGGYTGTVIAATAVPLWHEGGELMGPLFLATSISSGGAALRVIGKVAGTNTTGTEEDIEDVENLATIAELGLAVAREVMTPARVSKPLHKGLWGTVYQAGAVGAGMVGAFGLSLLGRLASPRVREVISSVTAGLSLIGALAERFAIVEGGKESAEDPIAYQDMTKGEPGEARPTAAQQAAKAPPYAFQHPYQHQQVAPDVPFYQATWRENQ